MKRWFDLRAGILTILFCVAAALPFVSTSSQRRDNYFFDVTLTSDAAGLTQVFWDRDRGLSESDSSSQPLKVETKPVVYRYMLPSQSLTGFRFDIIDREATLTFQNARVVDRDGHVIYTFRPEQFTPGNQVARFERKGDVIWLKTVPGANDPIVDVALDHPLTLTPPLTAWLRPAAPFIFVFLAAGLILGAPAIGEKLRSRTERLRNWIRANPRKAIAWVALGATVVQSHPVIFFGRSYVSPNNGSLMLYDHLPTLPGYGRTDFEGTMGSDVGAMLFQHLYYPMIERAALAQGELPLWNRYCSTGLPLLGQGQSMFGDPFNFLTILANGSAWAWDLRFVLAHFILAAGVGLSVWNYTRGIAAALLTTVSVSAIGMFLFRINHPATFTFCYSAILLWAWSSLVSDRSQRRLRFFLGLIAANWMVMMSGTVKEAFIIIACLNFAGFLGLVVSTESAGQRLRKLGVASAAGILLLVITVPWWMTFLVSLRSSYTSYDVPTATQYSLREFIDVFDEIFFQQAWRDETVNGPALNVVFLLALLGWLLAPERWKNERIGVALAIAGVFPLAMAFGIVPASIILRTPFIANIGHVGNTFTCPLLLIVILLGGFGIAAARDWLSKPGAGLRLLLGGLFIAGLAAAYFSRSYDHERSVFFRGYAASLGAAALAFVLGAYWHARSRAFHLGVLILALGLPLLLWRHIQYLKSPFDEYVFNPAERVDVHVLSPAVKAVNRDLREPSRIIGLEGNLYPSYNVALHWESLYSVDALRNRYFIHLADAVGLKRVFYWDKGPTEEDLSSVQSLYDVLNVRYFLGSKHDPQPFASKNLVPLALEDLTVYRSETTWPRAFFTQRVFEYRTPEEMMSKLRARPGELAAGVQRDDKELPNNVRSLTRRDARQGAVPASDYALTANSTSFTVEAPADGVIALHESYYPDSFRVTVNGKPANYFRLNHAFKGVYIPSAGTYRVSFSYWPKHFAVYLCVSTAGLLLLIAVSWVLWRLEKNHVSEPMGMAA